MKLNSDSTSDWLLGLGVWPARTNLGVWPTLALEAACLIMTLVGFWFTVALVSFCLTLDIIDFGKLIYFDWLVLG